MWVHSTISTGHSVHFHWSGGCFTAPEFWHGTSRPLLRVLQLLRGLPAITGTPSGEVATPVGLHDFTGNTDQAEAFPHASCSVHTSQQVVGMLSRPHSHAAQFPLWANTHKHQHSAPTLSGQAECHSRLLVSPTPSPLLTSGCGTQNCPPAQHLSNAVSIWQEVGLFCWLVCRRG